MPCLEHQSNLLSLMSWRFEELGIFPVPLGMNNVIYVTAFMSNARRCLLPSIRIVSIILRKGCCFDMKCNLLSLMSWRFKELGIFPCTIRHEYIYVTDICVSTGKIRLNKWYVCMLIFHATFFMMIEKQERISCRFLGY